MGACCRNCRDRSGWQQHSPAAIAVAAAAAAASAAGTAAADHDDSDDDDGSCPWYLQPKGGRRSCVHPLLRESLNI